MKRIITLTIIGLALLLLLLQFVQPLRTNPEVTADLEAPAEVKAVLQRCCYDCHSNETTWPWYSAFAPMSWVVTRHVDEGREHLNFSDWETYEALRLLSLSDDIIDQIQTGAMPMSSYLLLHPDAKLSREEKELLIDWAEDLAQ